MVTTFGQVDPLFLPLPGRGLGRLRDGLYPEGYEASCSGSTSRSRCGVAVAFFGALVIAVHLGMLVASSRMLEAIVDPFVNFYRVLPPLAYYPLLVIWYGIGETSKECCCCCCWPRSRRCSSPSCREPGACAASASTPRARWAQAGPRRSAT